LIFYIFFVVRFTGLLFVIISLILHMKLTYLKNLVLCYVGNFQLYNMLITAHGLLILLFIIIRIPVSNLVIFFLPLLITILDMAFSHMNNLRFWLLIPSVLLLMLNAFMEVRTETGWTISTGSFLISFWRFCCFCYF